MKTCDFSMVTILFLVVFSPEPCINSLERVTPVSKDLYMLDNLLGYYTIYMSIVLDKNRGHLVLHFFK